VGWSFNVLDDLKTLVAAKFPCRHYGLFVHNVSVGFFLLYSAVMDSSEFFLQLFKIQTTGIIESLDFNHISRGMSEIHQVINVGNIKICHAQIPTTMDYQYSAILILFQSPDRNYLGLLYHVS
jgi:hypothetical protein